MERPLPRGISTVVPVYRSASIVEQLVDRVGAVLERIGRPFELILVDDGSGDGSWEAISRCARTRPWVRGIRLMRNYGQHNALVCGVRAARYDTVATLDDDLQHDPAHIPQLLERLEQGYDLVYGKEGERRQALTHRLGSAILRFGLSVVMGARVAKIASPLRVFRTSLRRTFEDNRSPWGILDVFLSWGTTRVTAVEVPHHERADGGKSTYSLYRKLLIALDAIAGFSTMPLKVASIVGFAMTLFGTGILIYVLSIYLIYGAAVPGWVFLASTIAIFSGAQMFALGILGEYMARVFTRIMERPPYAVAEQTVAQAGDGERQHEREGEEPHAIGHQGQGER